ncbi:: hypothetical protein [Arcticibacter svalbardensis MN12-7]|uniref:SusD/RagB family nutrient-binding outer membrane lipoprotein n=1 Tax=Arcticibacter svalbardensis MN12-7 TaxID=1150600 RepID=R9GM87_9SPHI|nr:SusD/RagB family nutrient-binding outer membrane lipoprotein [Arcticibacter svalbardensis]EOR92806.1 : hypothetical protein [Arcticibacter svalbardensis MN12-7]
MKKILYILVLSVVFSSCKKWLDVNENPDSANSTVPTAEQRLPPILAQFADGYESAGTRVAFLSQQLAVTYAINNNWNFTRWYANASNSGWPWQAWYVNTAVNIDPMITAAEGVGAYHYIGVGKIMKAWGFGTLSDLFGMLPYDEFNNVTILTPKFEDGSYVQGKVLELLDEAIVDLKKTQEAGAPALSVGDMLNGGSTDKWIRLAYGLKARYLNHLTKKASYDPQAVLDALANAPQMDAQSSIYQYIDEGATVTSTSKQALQYTNFSTTARVTKLYYDYLTNNYTGAPTGATNVQDPRLDTLIPRSQNSAGVLVRSALVDMQSVLPKTGPIDYSYSKNTASNKDSIYVQMRKNPLLPTAGQRILSTGSWYTQKGGKGLLLTNAEMRFIEAEVKFRQNQPAAALTAYKAGIRSHMTIMGIASAKIEAYLSSSSVVQIPGNLTLSQIMIQKYIALSYSPEVFSDIRRMNYCADASGNYNESTGIYKGFNRPSHVYIEAYPNATDWPRRFAIPSYEINYNIEQVLKANPNASNSTYINEPIWWDKP